MDRIDLRWNVVKTLLSVQWHLRVREYESASQEIDWLLRICEKDQAESEALAESEDGA